MQYIIKKRIDVWNIMAVLCILAFSLVLLFRLGTIPTIFIDEGNGMYDSWSLAKYGVDSNLISNPFIYNLLQDKVNQFYMLD